MPRVPFFNRRHDDRAQRGGDSSQEARRMVNQQETNAAHLSLSTSRASYYGVAYN